MRGGFVARAVLDRMAGNRPSPLRAAAVAVVVGVAVAVMTYRLLRHEGNRQER